MQCVSVERFPKQLTRSGRALQCGGLPRLLPLPPPSSPQLRCLNAFGGAIPTAPRRVIGRCVLVNGTAYSLTASSPEERWEEVGPLLRAVVATFRK